MYADVNDEKVCGAAERDDILRKIREETFKMAQDKEVQRMLIQEKFDRMDIVTYGNERERKGEKRGDRQRMEHDAKGMYAAGLAPEEIAGIQEVSVDTIQEILGLQPV